MNRSLPYPNVVSRSFSFHSVSDSRRSPRLSVRLFRSRMSSWANNATSQTRKFRSGLPIVTVYDVGVPARKLSMLVRP